MPHKQKHRGPHPSDFLLFSDKFLPDLRNATADLSWLLSRGYSEKAALKLTGDHFSLNERQRKAVMRCACSDQSLSIRQERHCSFENLKNEVILIDGFNVIITVESALSGGLIFEGRDHCYRDIASVHGSYRKVEETEQAILLIGHCLHELQTGRVNWHLDQPVSNSGRLGKLILELAERNSWPWEVSLEMNPDKILAATQGVVASSDGGIIDAARRWYYLARYVIETRLPTANVIRLGA